MAALVLSFMICMVPEGLKAGRLLNAMPAQSGTDPSQNQTDAQGSPPKKRVYRIATIEWIAWSPKVKGFWAEEGLNVELVHYYGGPVLIDVIRAGKVDLSANMVGDVIGMHLQGIDMTILAEDKK